MKPDARAVIQFDPDTGPRLKHFSERAHIDYWTSLWRSLGHLPYDRAQKGHLPHQLRDTFAKWVRPGAAVLEAGCGLGHFTIALRARGYRAQALDWSEPTIAMLRARFPYVPWHVGDVRRLPFGDRTFDAVYSPGVCEHFIEGPHGVLEETGRVLRHGGIAVVSTPCFNGWLQRRPDLFEESEYPDAKFHEYAFTPAGLSTLLGRLGFSVLQVRPYASLATMTRYAGWRVPAALAKPLAVLLDYAPVTRGWGSTCLWVARKS